MNLLKHSKSFIFLTALLLTTLLSCHGPQIILERVSFPPDDFKAEKHFAKDMDALTLSNNYLLVTGEIDTAETGPTKMAIIAVNKNKIYLTLNKIEKADDKRTERYSGYGYNIELEYTTTKQEGATEKYKGQLTVTTFNLSSTYSIVGQPGYQ